MARGINKVILIGNLGNDPETRYTPSGSAVTNLSIATDESYKDKQGEMVQKTEWHRIVMFGKLAEIAQQYLKKGSKVYIEGKLQTRKWQDQSGQDRYTTEVVVDGFQGQMQMLDSRGSMDSPAANNGWTPQPQGSADAPKSGSGGYSKPSSGPQPQQSHASSSAVDDFDDDIPF